MFMPRVSTAIAFVVWSGSPALAASLLPIDFGGGVVPPDRHTLAAEAKVAKNLADLATRLAACYAAGVRNVFGSQPDGVAPCLGTALAGYDAKAGSVAPPSCLDQTAERDAVAAFVRNANAALYCTGAMVLPAATFGGGNIPDDAAALQNEVSFSRAVFAYEKTIARCYSKGAANLLAGRDAELSACVSKASNWLNRQMQHLELACFGFDVGGLWPPINCALYCGGAGTTPVAFDVVTSTRGGGSCAGHSRDSAGGALIDIGCLWEFGAAPVIVEAPDSYGATNRFAITGCTGTTCTLGPEAVTPPGIECTAAGCHWGLPLENYSPGACIVNTFTAGASGTVDLATGALTAMLPLQAEVFLTTGPCPHCVSGVCDGGSRVSQTCTHVGERGLSNDCPPGAPGTGFARLSFALPVTSGTATLTADAGGMFCPGQTRPGCFARSACRLIEETGAPAAGLGARPLTCAVGAGIASVGCLPAGGGLFDMFAGTPGPVANSTLVQVRLVP